MGAMNVFAIDVGGAFIKTAFLPASGKIRRKIIPFEMWKHPERLAGVLDALKPVGAYLAAVTMTGELCDCFKNRREGVRHIVRSASKVFGDVAMFGVKGGMMGPEEAVEKYGDVASANWAIPPLLVAQTERNFLLVDVGSTTTDLTPVRNGKIANKGFTDFGRLKHGELVYSGYLRTPVQFLVRTAKLGKREAPFSSEYFCIAGDAHLILGDISRSKYLSPTPDGGPKTKAGALRRLSRAMLADEGELASSELRAVAKQVAEAQRDEIVRAAARFGLPLVTMGTGAFILDEAFKNGALEMVGSAKRYRWLDPSLALALLVSGRGETGRCR
ncbi:MAG: hypothetical protein HY098_03015 [Nitrospinae bacterium]|nr:hypothetical protein [Nitrospinota bacterium]